MLHVCFGYMFPIKKKCFVLVIAGLIIGKTCVVHISMVMNNITDVYHIDDVISVITILMLMGSIIEVVHTMNLFMDVWTKLNWNAAI